MGAGLAVVLGDATAVGLGEAGLGVVGAGLGKVKGSKAVGEAG